MVVVLYSHSGNEGNMDIVKATKLSFDLRRQTCSGSVKLRADVEDGRMVFSGGSQGVHSIDLGVSTPRRVLAHWEGYCENDGMPAPRAGDKVFFVGHTGRTYRGTVAATSPKHVLVDFFYRHGGAGHAKVRFGDLRFEARLAGGRRSRVSCE